MGVRLPRLLDQNMNEVARLRPSKMNVEPNGDSLSTASMTLPNGEPKVHVRDWMELYTEHGSAGIYRVTRQKDDIGNEQRVTLAHGLCALEDAVIPGEGKLSGSPAAVLKAILSHQKRTMWTLGTVASGPTIEIEYSYINALEALENALEKLPDHALTFDQTVMPWKLGLVKLSNEDGSEARLSRNLRGVTVEDEDSELCTRVYVDDREGYTDGPTIDTWGVIERVLTVPDGATEADVKKYVNAYLQEHKNPSRTITLDAYDLSGSTGEPLDAFRLWNMARVPLPAQSELLRERITALIYPSVFDDPLNTRVTMGKREKNLSDMLADMRKRATKAERAAVSTGKRVSRNSSAIQKNITRLEDTYAGLVELDGKTADRFNEVFIDLDAKQAQINLKASSAWVSDLEQGLNSAEIKLDGLKAEMQLKVDGNGVIAAINLSPETVKISASKIVLDGYVTASQLSASEANFSKFFSGDAFISSMRGGSASFDNFYGTNVETTNLFTKTLSVNRQAASWKSAELVTGVSLSLTRTDTTLYMAPSSGAPATVQVRPVTGGSVSTSTTTINYLGR